MKSFRLRITRLITAIVLGFLPFHGTAQWLTQTVSLSSGWNAVFLNVEASYDTLDHLVGGDAANPIQEIWLWAPSSGTGQFLTSPSSPFSAGTQWVQWQRSSVNISANPLNTLHANQALLVRTTNAYSWSIKGVPAVPQYNWTSSGENFIGFPANPTTSPTFSTYLSVSPSFDSGASIFAYTSGIALGSNNPVQIPSSPYSPTNIVRGRAYWVYSTNYNSYFAPFEVSSGATGLTFGSNGGQASVTLVNRTANILTVYVNLAASETPPAGQVAIRAIAPVLARGTINPQDHSYNFTDLNSSTNLPITLAPVGSPGATVNLVLGLNQAILAAYNPGDQVAAILKFTDSAGLSEIDVPVSAVVTPTTGLWVGTASITNVSQYLSTYYTASSTNDMNATLQSLGLVNGANGVNYTIDPDSSRIMAVTSSSGAYLSTSSTVTNSGVPQTFNLRLILHMGTNGALATPAATLLQHVYVGLDAQNNQIVATTTNLLASTRLASARRISAIHFPWQGDDQNSGWIAREAPSSKPSILTFSVPLDYNDQASNPFVHNYHPDHDNLDANFDPSPLPNGLESFSIYRTIRLLFTGVGTGFNQLSGAGGHLQGNYLETVTITDGSRKTRNFDVAGSFILNQLNSIGALSYAADSSYGAGAQNLSYSQVINFPPVPDLPAQSTPYSLVATSSSGLPVSFTVLNGPATVTGNSLSMTGLGSVTINATQPGGRVSGTVSASAALPVRQTFNITTGSNVITFPAITSFAYGTGPVPLGGMSSSGLAVIYRVISGPGMLSGTNLSASAVGTIQIEASQAGNAMYIAAVPVTNSVVVGIGTQAITFATIPTQTYGGPAVNLSATASSGLPVTYSIVSGSATVSGSTLTYSGAGTVVVSASQSGNANYQAAAGVQQTFTVNKVAQSITTSNVNSTGKFTRTIATLAPLSFRYLFTSLNSYSASSSSGLPVTITISDTAGATLVLNAGGTLTVSLFTSAGILTDTVTVTYSQAGDVSYAAAPSVSVNLSLSYP